MVVRISEIGGAPMRGALSGFFNDTLTILEPTGTQDAYGEVLSTWATLRLCAN